MKKILLLILLSITNNYVFADTGVSTVTWNNNNAECGTTVSHGITHYGVPNTNYTDITAVGSLGCTTHAYYTSGDYVKAFTLNGGITGCAPGERVVAWNAGAGTMTCRKYDDTAPTISYTLSDGAILANNTWTNKNVTSNIVCNDTGGSNCDISSYQYRKENTFFTCNSSGVWTNGSTYNHNVLANSQNVEYICFRAKDIAGNGYSYSSVATIKIDKIVPNVSTDLTDTFPSINPSNNSNLLASNIQTFTITPSNNGGSPIAKIQGYFEDSDSCSNGFHTRIDSNTTYITTHAGINNIKEVKPGCDFNAGGYREYSFKITYFEDEAGNYLGTLNAPSTNAGLKTYNYKVFANTIATNIYIKDVTTDQVTDINNIADGTQKNLIITLKDLHNNPIIPASTIGRNISFTFDVNNNLFLNQSNNTGGSAVFMSIPSDSSNFLNNRFSGAGNQTQTFSNQTSTNGTYNFGFKVYSPTNHLVTGNDFRINDIKYSINSTIAISTGDNPLNQTVGNSSKTFSFKPIYYTNQSGDIVDNGFVEGSYQTGTIEIVENSTSVIPIDKKYSLLLTGSLSANFTGTGMINYSEISKKTIGKTLPGVDFITNWVGNTITKTLSTLFTLTNPNGYIDDIKDISLYSYITYTIQDFSPYKTVTYLVGKINETNNQNFETLKILGITNINIDKQKDLVINQDTNDIKNLAGEINKTILRKDLVKNAINVVKYVDISNGSNYITDLTGTNWNISNGGNKLGNILYFSSTNTDINNVVLDNGNYNNTDFNKFEGRKTIVIVGKNLYIKSNVINSTNTDVLGIIVLKDSNGNGGKVYIDTSVQEVDAIIYAEKSVMSYNTNYDNGSTDVIVKHEIDGNINNTTLNNQLFIYGTVFSENTIGGSRKNPPICPFYTQSISGFTCNTINAQKYDFNYLRSGTNNKYKASYPDYPVVIKYNSMIQSTPPPLFEQK